MSSGSVTDEIETEDESDGVSEGPDLFPPHRVSSGMEQLAYSDDFRDSQASFRYSDDFDSSALSVSPAPRSARTPRPVPRPRRSVNTSLRRSEAEDGDPEAGPEAGPDTARSAYSVSFTEDWERYSSTPRRAVRARTAQRLRSLETHLSGYSDDFESISQTTRTPRCAGDGTARSALNTGYSDDFESRTYSEKTSRRNIDTRYSTDTLYSYTQSFDDESSSEARTVSSNNESTESRSDTSYSEDVTVTENTFTDSDNSSYTFTDATTTDSEQKEGQSRGAEEEAAHRQFILHKLSVALENPTKPRKAAKAPVCTPDKNVLMFYKKKLGLLRRKGKDYNHDGGTGTIEKPRRHLSAMDESNVENLGIRLSHINKLKTENAIGRMKKFVNEEIHEPSSCNGCRDQVTAMALREYARKKKTLVEGKLIEDRIENNGYLYGDVVALMGEGIADLPSYNTSNKDILKRLLHPWSSQLWGSEILKEQEQANSENISPRRRAPSGPTLNCPLLANFESDTSELENGAASQEPSRVPLLFDDVKESEGKSQTENSIQRSDNVFAIYAGKVEPSCREQSEPVSTRRPERRAFPEGEHWEDVRSRLDMSQFESRVPETASQETLPVGLHVPEDREQFWRHYFSPLKTCSWFPNGAKI